MLFVLLSKRFLHMTVLDGFAFVAIHANLLDRYITNRINKQTAPLPSKRSIVLWFRIFLFSPKHTISSFEIS